MSGSLMLVKKTIKAKILELREGKKRLLQEEYDNFQRYLRGDKNAKLYSATKQQADRFLIKLKKQNGGILDTSKDYPLILRNDVYDIRKEDTKLTQYWIRIPVAGKRGGINCPIALSSNIPDGAKLRESKIIKKDSEWFVYITIQKEVEIKKEYNNIIAIDLGIRRIATIVSTADKRPKFYGKELRRVRGHYFYLKRKLGRLKKFKAIKKIGSKERRIVVDFLHKISREIVKRAKEENALIVLGNLKGIRKQNKGRKFNRKLNTFPYYRLSRFIEYKATWEGIAVIKVNESNTSKTCSRCDSQGLRHNGRFVCEKCGIELNADYNGAMNILKRALGYISRVGAGLTQPLTRYDERLSLEKPRISRL